MPHNFKPIEVAEENGCHVVISHVVAPTGYVLLRRGGPPIHAHRYLWELWNNAKIPEGKLVMHTCDNRRCVNPEHLVVGSYADNAADMVAKGRSAHSEKGGRTKLTREQALEVKHSLMGQRALGRKFGISHTAVQAIQKGVNWRYLAERGWPVRLDE